MFVKSLKIKNIRNYKEEEIKFDENINILLGKNGQGKTNLIEAIYISSFSKSFRTNNERDIVKFNEEIGEIKIDYSKDNEDNKIEYFIKNNGKKNIKVNGLKIEKISQLIGNLLVVVFYPDDLKIIKEEPEKRRAFINRELCQLSLSYYNCLSNYNKVLMQRNKYLKEDDINIDILEIWDQNLVKYGNEIIKKREEFIKKLNNISSNIYNSVKKEEILKIEYERNIKENEDFYEILRDSYKKDLNNRITTRGPHKDDIKILINEVDARKFGSQGQQRTAALSLKLAEIEIIKELKEENPIVLLDDVFSELDEERQELIIKHLKDVQLFITTTHISSNIIEKFEGINKIFNIENGNITSPWCSPPL